MPDQDIELTDEIWQAIIGNDGSLDGTLIYAVKTTGIFCRPSCKSKPPNKTNIRLFRNVEQALGARFRPCKRCKPTGERLPDDEWVSLVEEYIGNRYMEPLTLDHLAEASHGSPYHLHRTFKRIKGVTPLDYVQNFRIAKAKELLAATDLPVAIVGSNVGLPNAPYFITLFKRKTGLTPAQYRRSLLSDSHSQGGTLP